jgi:hypothetical protein
MRGKVKEEAERHCIEDSLDSVLVLTQLVNHERLNLLGL